MKTSITGIFRKSIFVSDKGYTIGLIKIKETNDEEMDDHIGKIITFTGYFHELKENENYIMYGKSLTHPKYGFQYEVSEFERVKPEGRDAVVEFLSSDLFPKMGEKTAKKIVDKLGENVINMILENHLVLLLVPGIKESKALEIHNILKEYSGSEEIVINLSNMGFNMKDALKIYNKYKERALSIINDNIYSLIDNDDLTFLKIDQIFTANDGKNDDERRLKAAVIYFMENACFSRGDTYLEKDYMYLNIKSILKCDIPYEDFSYILGELNKENKVIIIGELYYLKKLYDAEENIANTLKRLNNCEPDQIKGLEKFLKRLESDNDITYNETQKSAIKNAVQKNLSIITGGPGTGKTTIIKAIVEIYRLIEKLSPEKLISSIALLAPTGRASKRMSETTLLPASTIHRFLKWNKEDDEFMVNEWNKSDVKFVIVDEVSMIDTYLMDSLFRGLRSDVKIVFVGDYNQLPSVGPGQILKDIIESEVIDVTYLNYIYRTDESSYINTLADEIKENNLSEDFLKKRSDYNFIVSGSGLIRNYLSEICKSALEKGYDVKDIQVLIPVYKGENGIDNVNKTLQEVFNPSSLEKRELKVVDIIFRENDKVIELVNMPDENVFNGDIGIVNRIIFANESESKKNEIHVDFYGNIVKYLPSDFINLKHSYAISVHKSQGSEFKIVLMPIVGSYYNMLTKKLIYTGLTRAKSSLVLLGNPESFVNGVSNDNEYKRNTRLKGLLLNSV